MKWLFVVVVAVVLAACTTPVKSAPAPPPVDFAERVANAMKYAETRPGVTGIVVRDRQTGAVWRNRAAATHAWACSTPKLAMAVDLLLRNDSGAVRLTDEDRKFMHDALHTSDNDAAHALWNRFGGEAAFEPGLRSRGMTDMRFTAEHPHHWGWILTTPDDLDRVITFVLNMLPAQHRSHLVNELRTVAPNQQWGVWAAGSKAMPGNKNGWSDDNDDGSWVVNSVGFAGPAERYTVAIMSNTKVIDKGFEVGVETTSKISSLLFEGFFP
ncbi:serine hydrolase [Allokutzneria sp. NRRL B-24872]|uniref:serine hydrolase n=1 Tax=Allokutzneria sp. NRRL B-24872 TaxID=1137961 RepID=UPI000A3BD214|nr:serine hydrolase [Allokutzneria sp. NRRL B-24872]